MKKTHHALKHYIIVTLFMGICSCAHYPLSDSSNTNFQMAIDSRGEIRNFSLDEDKPIDELKKELARIEASIEKQATTSQKERYTRIALIVHGGLTNPNQAQKGADKIAFAIEQDNNSINKRSKIFPIFINWNTGFFSSYGRHLVAEDSGVSRTSRKKKLSMINPNPYMIVPKFVGDMGTGIVKAPLNISKSFFRFAKKDPIIGKSLLRNYYPVSRQFNNALEKEFDPVRKLDFRTHLHKNYTEVTSEFQFNFELGKNEVPQRSERLLMNTLWSPVKIVTSVAADSMGSPGWRSMKRRAKLLAFRPALSDDSADKNQTRGAGNILITELAKICERQNIKLELYGHSMGAIVLNELIASTHMDGFGTKDEGNHPVKPSKIVYMAAACRISNFIQTTGRHIEKYNTPFYNLTLHPVQEIRESFLDDWGSFIFSGSLLTWIDGMFENPPSFQDRTLGTIHNVIVARKLLPKGRHIHYKAFPAAFRKDKLFYRDKMSDLGPQKHGAFNEYHFWRKEFYSVSDTKREQTYKKITKIIDK